MTQKQSNAQRAAAMQISHLRCTQSSMRYPMLPPKGTPNFYLQDAKDFRCSGLGLLNLLDFGVQGRFTGSLPSSLITSFTYLYR